MKVRGGRALATAGALLASLAAPALAAPPRGSGPFDDGPKAASNGSPGKRIPHELKPFVDKLRSQLEDAEALVDGLIEKGASPAALAFALELLKAQDAPDYVLKRALRSTELETLLDDKHPAKPSLPRAKQLLDLLASGKLLETLTPPQFDLLAGALRVELRSDRASVADTAQLPPLRSSLGEELAALAKVRLPAEVADELRSRAGLPADAPLDQASLKALAANAALSIPDLLGLVGRVSRGADAQERTLTPVTAPRRLREFRDALAASPRRPGPAPAANEPVFSIPGHQGGASFGGGGGGTGGVSLDEGGPGLRVVQGPQSSEMFLPRQAKALDSRESAEANRLKAQATQTLARENPVFPVELFSNGSVAQCNGAFASSTGSPVELGFEDEKGRAMCEMPYQTARHCVEPRPQSIRIARLSRQPFAAPRIAVSRKGDQATVGIEMPCDEAKKIPMLKIAGPSDISRAKMAVLFTNPKRHVDDGRKFLVMGMSGGNEDFLGFNADLIDDRGERVNGGVGTRVGDSGGPFVVYGDDGIPLFAGVNSFGVFPPGQDPKVNPNAYAQQGGIANGGRRQTIALINDVREQGRASGVLTAVRAPRPATHDENDQRL